jgi:phosphoribosylaminoimidazolecarboxamide formyltransferase/IMP cyclohydrolase
MNALISVFDKEGIVDFAKELSNLGIRIIATGGTSSLLRKEGFEVKEVSELTDFPEMLDGRVKTLHPIIYGGILADRKNKSHMETLKKLGIPTIDFVICNLYSLEKMVQEPENITEGIDIGGPALIRAAAKNYRDVVVLTSPSQYKEVIEILKSKKEISLEKRRKYAIEAFSHTAYYDSIISNYLRERWKEDSSPKEFSIPLRKVQTLRYGENPHQKSTFYKFMPELREACIINAKQIQGKDLSFNNMLDSDCAVECIKEFLEPACVIVKHATPCGVACSDNLLEAWKQAYETDIYSPFGGIVSFNREVRRDLAEELSKYFLEIIIAPSFDKEALSILGEKKNLRLLELKGLEKGKKVKEWKDFRSVVGGCLVQDRDTYFADKNTWKIVTEKKPSKKDLSSMEFAVKCVKHAKSNSVVFVKDKHTVAIGSGQPSRVDATWIAAHKGKEKIRGSIMASDAFFPFRDAVDVAAKAGVKAIIQPGGSIRDREIIKAANEHGIIMVFSGQRYFRH